jgi:hypothetical protein
LQYSQDSMSFSAWLSVVSSTSTTICCSLAAVVVVPCQDRAAAVAITVVDKASERIPGNFGLVSPRVCDRAQTVEGVGSVPKCPKSVPTLEAPYGAASHSIRSARFAAKIRLRTVPSGIPRRLAICLTEWP